MEMSVTASPLAPAKPEYDITPNVLNAFRLGELWRYRHLATLLALRQIRARYKQTALGLLWAIIVPVAFTTIFVIFFRLVPAQPSGELPYVPVAFAGMLMWQLFSRGVSDAGTSLTANANLITKVYFPRTILPLAAIVSAMFDAAISFLLSSLSRWFWPQACGWPPSTGFFVTCVTRCRCCCNSVCSSARWRLRHSPSSRKNGCGSMNLIRLSLRWRDFVGL
jgi:ABC-type polysaccharide/polyol phosphate export permease